MKVTVVSRSGREVIKGGLELSDSVRFCSFSLIVFLYFVLFGPLPPKKRRMSACLSVETFACQVISLTQFASLTSTARKFYPSRQRIQGLGPSSFLSYTFLLGICGSFGPLSIFYYFPVYRYFGYKGERVIHPVQTYALYYWCFHYFKRIMETFFVHRFSHATSPLSNVFRNCAYYWSFGSYIAYCVNHPLYTPVSDLQMKIGFGFGLFCQISNFYCHMLLRNLRSPAGNGGYQIPHGFLFNIVTCANYTTEIYQWLGFNIATQTVAGYSFLIVAALIMTNWALAKHRRLKKLFDGKDGRPRYPRRWVILPPFL
ncbi:hypothetical protein I3842_Q061000 [Carya illinoinensis]|uniref:3-oxo-5-alpha-steroid 4-dehydrogenase C-terminal domain-containing protein n=1 Tax=Carya illinoinensis TaxID=32201 RepID=A0A922A1K1_CARIL|nr:hypothetical protein I3842_Q061000 [Carya illinoinensis]